MGETVSSESYDILVIGSGPGGQRAALQAAKLGKRVAIIERRPYIGGAGLHTGTLPSKTLRETAVFLSGFKQRAVYGFQFTLGREVRLSELMHRKSEVIRAQMEVVIDQFGRNNVEIIYGEASFAGDHEISVTDAKGATRTIDAGVVVIATGSRPVRPGSVPFESGLIYDSDTILELDRIPSHMAVIGAGVIGCEYACIFAALGVEVTLIDRKKRLLEFADEEVVTSLIYWMRHSGVTFKLGEEVEGITVDGQGEVSINLKSSKVVTSDKLLYTMGRTGNVDGLNLEFVGITPTDRGYIPVDEFYRTTVPHVYAVGDVIGFPSLASTSREQGRRAVCNAFEEEGQTCELAYKLPLGIYTIPEISMVGATEEELTAEGVDYEVGTAFFNEVARGQIIGDTHGMLKLIFERRTRRLLGVHIVGERASELIHIGQVVLNYGGPIDYFKDVVFNYPTLSDAYKEAALNGLNRL